MPKLFRISSPGRINLIGEHTDYSFGYVMPMAVNLYTFFDAIINEKVNIYSENLKDWCKFDPLKIYKKNDWTDYIRGIYNTLLKRGFNIGGCKGKIYGNLPMGTGLSSSASFELAILYFLNLVYSLNLSRLDMIKIAKYSENNFVGVPCGIMDQFAVAMGKMQHTIFLDTETMEYEYIKIPEDIKFLVFYTGIKRELAKSGYIERRKMMDEVLNITGKKSSKYITMKDISKLPEIYKKRVGYVIRENDRVLKARDALKSGNLKDFGEILTDSHWDISRNYEVSSEELDFFVNFVLKHGALGARLTGAGFGGSALAIFPNEGFKNFEKEIRKEYMGRFPYKPKLFMVKSTDGVKSLEMR